MTLVTITEGFESGTQGDPIPTSGIVLVTDVGPVYDHTHTHSGVMAASGLGGAIAFRYAGDTSYTQLFQSSSWTYLVGPVDDWSAVPLVSYGLATGDQALAFYLTGGTLYVSEGGGTLVSTGVDLPLETWIEWLWDDTEVLVRTFGATLWLSDPVPSPELMSNVLHYLPAGQMWLDDFTGVFDVIPTSTCLQNAERSSCIHMKAPDGSWFDVSLVGV